MNFVHVLEKTQEYISKQFADTMPDRETITNHIRHFLLINQLTKEEDTETLCNRLIDEMQGFSILTPLLEREDVEEININRWDDVKVTYTNGITKPAEHFLSPSHATDIVRRMLLASNMVWDNSSPIQVGHLQGNIRVTVCGFDILDREAGLAVSIRKITASDLPREGFLAGNTCTADMIDLLRELYVHGISLCIAGSTGSGKTTLLSYLIKQVPDHCRLLTVEQGTREFDCVRRESGSIQNNVVHLQTRLSKNPEYSITQEKLVETMMTMNPDYIAVGESKGAEAMQVINAANTGHAVITTTHANSCADTYFRLLSLCKMKYPNMDEELLKQLAVRAFPVTVYIKKMQDNSRRILQICESEYQYGKIVTRPIYHFRVQQNSQRVQGKFEMVDSLSDRLCNQLIQNGMDSNLLRLCQKTKRYRKKEEVR